MRRKIDEPNGVFISPEFREAVGRLKDREAELDEIIDRDTDHRGRGEDNGERESSARTPEKQS